MNVSSPLKKYKGPKGNCPYRGIEMAFKEIKSLYLIIFTKPAPSKVTSFTHVKYSKEYSVH